MMIKRNAALVLALLVFAGACHKSKPPVAKPLPPSTPSTTASQPPTPEPPKPATDTTTIPKEPAITEDPIAAADLDTINKNSPFHLFFKQKTAYEIDGTNQQALSANAAIL